MENAVSGGNRIENRRCLIRRFWMDTSYDQQPQGEPECFTDAPHDGKRPTQCRPQAKPKRDKNGAPVPDSYRGWNLKPREAKMVSRASRLESSC